MPPMTPGQSAHHAGQQQQPQQTAPPPSTPGQNHAMGRSQSAFNFLLNKAKAPFSSSASTTTTGMSSSTSMSSITADRDESSDHLHYHRQLQTDHAFPDAPHTTSSSSKLTSERMSRAATSEGQPLPKINPPFSRPSTSEDHSASPSRKGFFSREKKPSSTSVKLPPPQQQQQQQRAHVTQSPLTRSSRQDVLSNSNAQFSKSQSDLHARPDLSSPSQHLADLPRMPSPNQQYPASANPARYLRSPSPATAFSRSVDDLNSSLATMTPPFASTPGSGEITSTATTPTTSAWGDHSMPSPITWRPNGSGASKAQQRGKAAHNKIESVSQTPSSAASTSVTLQHPSSRTDPKHSRKISRLGGKDVTGRSVVASSLAATLGLATPATSTFPNQSVAEPVVLPPGASHQGFLARNTNISLSLAQLNEYDHGKGCTREKDIAKGWKPYRVVLQDGKLLFYKPSSTHSDEVKALFPNTVVRSSPLPGASTQDPMAALTPEALVRGGLSKTELLSATASTSDSLASQPPRVRPPAARSTSNNFPQATNSPGGITPQQAWVLPGSHSGLILAEHVESPKRWVDRIVSGSAEALADEYVRATQRTVALSSELDADEAEAFIITVLYSSTLSVDHNTFSTFLSSLRVCAQSNLDLENDQSRQSSKARLAIACKVVARAGLAHTYQRQLKEIALLVDVDLTIFNMMDGDEQVPQEASLPDWVAVVAEHNDGTRDDLREMRSTLSISDTLLLRLEPQEIAQQIQAFHVQCLQRMSRGGLTFAAVMKVAVDASTVKAFSFDSMSPHPITALVLSHVLGPASSSSEPSTTTNQNGARHRASVLRHWIAVASYLLSFGDVTGWLAVSAALCSRAVVRLEQTWRYLAEGDRLLVAREWAPVLSSLDWVEGSAVITRPRFYASSDRTFVEAEDGRKLLTIPYLGNALCHLVSSQPEGTIKIAANANQATNLRQVVYEWQSSWQSDGAVLAEHVSPLPEYQASLQMLFSDESPPRRDDYESFMQRSFRMEPKKLGLLDARQRQTIPAGVDRTLPLVPLLFPQPLPLLSLLDAHKIGAGLLPKDDRRVAEDARTTTSARNRGGLARSPLLRSSIASPALGLRSIRNTTFSGILEWNSNSLVPSDDAGNFIKVGNELVLRVVHESSVSLPCSPMMNKRFSQTFGRSNRPLSQMSRRSSLPASNRNSVVDAIVPIQVVVKSATLARLIDLLVMGVKHLSIAATQSGADFSDVFGGPMRKSKLTMDLDEFRATFLATFRSLCSPVKLFEHLHKRFSAAVNASRELSAAETFETSSQFPSWISLTPIGSRVEPTDWDMVHTIRMGVIHTLMIWIDRFPQDFADDDHLYQLGLAFFSQAITESSPMEGSDEQRMLSSLKKLQKMFITCIMGANARQGDGWYATSQPVQIGAIDKPAEFDFDRASPADLVDYLESIATVFFDKIIDRDLLVASEIFEGQACKPTGWFASKNGTSAPSDDEKPINSMYTLLDVLKPPGAKATDFNLQQKLPAAIRDALAAQSLFRGWIAIHIIEANIGLEMRQQRLLKLIDALWICRSRMYRLRTDDVGGDSIAESAAAFGEPTIGSFVESAIVSTLGSSESRIFLRAWQGVAVARSGKGDSLSDLYPKEIDAALRATTDLSSTPDIGWILTCLAEASTRLPVTHDNAELDLIDFDKRRTMWALIDGAMRVRPSCSSPELIDLAGTRLKLMQTSLTRISWDRRAFKEDAANEMRTAPPLPQQSTLRQTSSLKALSGVSKQQQEKLRRERAALEILRNALAGPAISSRMSSMPASNSQSSVSTMSSSANTIPFGNPGNSVPQAAPADRTVVRTRRMTALFKGAVRPLMPSEKHDAPARSVNELMRLTPISKPSIVAGLGGAHVVAWNNTQRSFVFHLTSEEGAKYLLQAPSAQELNEWIAQIGKVALERTPLTHKDDTSRSDAPGRSKTAVLPVFGRPLGEVVEREGVSVPIAMERMFAEVEARGLREVGIYRISGSKSAVDGLRRAWDQLPSDAIDLAQGDWSDIHTITGTVKTWLRELPDPVITHASYDAIIASNELENDDRLYAMRDIIWRLPKCHFDMLRRTAEHLARVVEEGEHNKMLSHNIGLIFGTSLLNPPPGPMSVAIGFGNIGKAANVVKTIVTMHEWLFEPEPEPEPEGATEQTSEPAESTMNAISEASTSNDSQMAGVAAVEEEEEEEEGDLPELVEQPRRSGRRRPMTLMGLDSLGAEEQAMLRSCSDENHKTESVMALSEIAQPSQADEMDGAVMPTIVLSHDENDHDYASSSSSHGSRRAIDEALVKLTASSSIDDTSSAGECSDTGEAVSRPPKTTLTPSGYRDSIYSSYTIDADCLDNMKLDRQVSATSMVANRRSAVLIAANSPPNDF